MNTKRGLNRPLSGPGHLAGGVIGPIAVETGHAPFDAPGSADHAGILADRVVHLVLAAVADIGRCGAEPARNCVRRPRAERDLAHALEPDDLQVRVPVLAFLLGKAPTDGVERRVAGGQHAVVTRAGQVDARFEPARGGCRRCGEEPQPTSEDGGKNKTLREQYEPAERTRHLFSPAIARATLSQLFGPHPDLITDLRRRGLVASWTLRHHSLRESGWQVASVFRLVVLVACQIPNAGGEDDRGSRAAGYGRAGVWSRGGGAFVQSSAVPLGSGSWPGHRKSRRQPAGRRFRGLAARRAGSAALRAHELRRRRHGL